MREMLGMEENEYVISIKQGQILVGNSKNNKTRTLKDIQGLSATMFLMGAVLPYAQREVVNYFKIPIKPLQHILMSKSRFKGYAFEVDGKEKTLKIGFEAKLNGSQLKELFGRIRHWNTTLNKGTSAYERVKPIEFFDEKLNLMLRYDDLQERYPTRIPEEELEPLKKEMERLLGAKATYANVDFYRMISEFRERF
jgi:hypothetical protein